jgi:hypothetical protein
MIKVVKARRGVNGDGKRHDFRRLYEALGLAFGDRLCGDEAEAEECPYCGRDKFHVNVTDGQFHCKHCGAEGNPTTYLTRLHAEVLSGTTAEHYSHLGEARGVSPQTLRRHELAYDSGGSQWLVPFKATTESVVNLQRYLPGKPKPNKFMLPELPASLYRFDRLAAAGRDVPVLLCEGPWDAVALDYNLGANRGKYVVAATPGTFKEVWAEHFRGRKVRVLFDNDEGGRQQAERVGRLLGESGVAEELLCLKWPEGHPDGCDLNDLVREADRKPVLGWLLEHCRKAVRQPKLLVYHGRRPASEDRPIEWVWPHRLRTATYASFSGRQGTFKTTIALDIAARYTAGRPMPLCKAPGLPAGHVLYLHAEDNRGEVEDGFERAGGDFGRWHVMPAVTRDGDPLNVLDHLEEIRGAVREYGTRLVVIDGQNSVVGAPCIATDMLARNNVTNKLHQFAQKENLCLLGVRNEDADGRALGPQSMGDIARCVMRAYELTPRTDPPYLKLEFLKVSDTARSNYRPIPYSVKDLGGAARKILWGKSRPPLAKGAK